MSDDLVKLAREWREDGSPEEPFYATGHLIDAMADRIEELEAKLAKAVKAVRGWIEFANAEGMPVLLSDLEAAELTGGRDDEGEYEPEYVRANLVQAAVAAALREAANIARASLDGELGYDDILALITPDAQAALDRVVAEAKMDGAEIARQTVWNKLNGSQQAEQLCDAIAAAIRKGGE